MDVYYSHAMPLYGTIEEENEKQQILSNISNANIVDPGSFQDNPEKRRGGMEYCLKLVEKCDELVFSKYFGKITAGVGKEINHALSMKMSVHELWNGKLRRVTREVKYLSRLATRRLYWDIRMNSAF